MMRRVRSGLIKAGNAVHYSLNMFLVQLLKLKPVGTQQNTMLVIRLDSIGDYILVRNFFHDITSGNRFHGFSLTLIGNSIWKEIAESYDSDIFSDFIWIDRKRFYRNPFYRFAILRRVHSKGFEIVVDSTFSREVLYGDVIVRASCSPNRIGSIGAPDKHVAWKRALLTNTYYTSLITTEKENQFEFYRNRGFFENFLGLKLNTQYPSLPVTAKGNRSKFIVIAIGAQHGFRKWSRDNFLSLVKCIAEQTEDKIIMVGTRADSGDAQIIKERSGANKVINECGKTSLTGLISLLSNAALLISNDTGTIHIAAAVRTPFVCISNGNHFGRFVPYPPEVFERCEFIFPVKAADALQKNDASFRFASHLDINSIEVEQVLNAVFRLLP